jgi:nitrogen fixation/metabolism regulation signal transduction histidine kinase
VVKKIVEEHGAHIELSNRKTGSAVQGGQVVVSLQVAN